MLLLIINIFIMITKVCFRCLKEKDLNEYYVHKKMADGHLNKCKDCTKNDAKLNHYVNSENIDWIEKQRARHREKYKRLGYKEKQKLWDEKRPHCKNQKYSNLSRKLKTEKGIELHHWNYTDEFIEDVFFLKLSEHRKAHTFLKKHNTYLFSDLDNNILDTREKHFNYLVSKGIKF